MVDEPLEHHCGAEIIGGSVALDLVHRLADADFGGEVNDAVGAPEGRGDRLSVTHVAPDELDLRIEELRAISRAVNLLNKSTIDGKEYVAYRSVEKSGADARGSMVTRPVHRTIYVDPETGLPAVNIVVEDKPGATPLFRGVYAYPSDLEIEGHPDAPLAKIR